MGTAFDPEKFCDLTGLRLYQKAVAAPVPYGGTAWRIGYFRADGVCRRFRDATAEELAWIVANPRPFQAADSRFKAWIAGFEKN